MTRFDFMKYVSNQPSQFHGSYSKDELKDWISEAYDNIINTEKIISFFSGIGHMYFNRIETKSGDELSIDLRWLNCIEDWEDIGCAVNSIGFISNNSGRIEQFYISERGKFYNQNHKLIAENEEEFFDYIATVEYDFHPEIKQRTYDMLRFFGWHEDRCVDTTEFENTLKQFGIELSKKQLDFFREFSGLAFTFNDYEWSFATLEEIKEKGKYAKPESHNDNKIFYSVVWCGRTEGGSLAVDSEGIILSRFAIPLGRTTMECVNHLCEGVPKSSKWVVPNQDEEQDLKQFF